MSKYLKLLRVKHYIKNILLFVPLVFSGELFNISKFMTVLVGLLCFSFISSVVYIINDIRDVEQDRKHETKCKRPIASKEISINHAYIIAIFLFSLSIGINILLSNSSSLFLILFYFSINVLYSLGLKNIVLFDIFIVTVGFVLRIFYGALIIDVEVSNWLYLTIMSMSLYLSLGKRRNEMLKYSKDETRKVLKNYTFEFLDKSMYSFFGISIVFYSLWALENPRSDYLLLSIPLIIIIFMKYIYTLELDSSGDPVEVILGDLSLIFIITLYALLILSALYFVDILKMM